MSFVRPEWFWFLCSAASCASPGNDPVANPDAGPPLDAPADSEQADEGATDDAPSCQQIEGSIWALWPMPDPTLRDAGASQTYDASSAEVVIDAVTHLAWQRNVDSIGRTWDEARAYCSCSRIGGYRDWHLPTRIELVSIVDFTKADPALDGMAFPSTPGEYF
jgi:Protein of unknown function (DUF1566)